MLEEEKINSFYGKAHVLRDLSFSVPRGHVAALLGRNGAGNTTTMKSIMQLVRPARGTVTWTQDMLFDLYANLAERRNYRGKALSGGEQQMLTIARTLMGNPSFILLDEPSEGVAPVIVEQMVKVIRQLKAEGVTVLLSEQNLHFAQAVADLAVIIESGEPVFHGSLDELKARPEIRDAYLAA